MSQYYIKRKSIHSFIQWFTTSRDRAELHLDAALNGLRRPDIDEKFRQTLLIEKKNAEDFLKEYDDFIVDLNVIEKLVLRHIIRYDNNIKGLSEDRYNAIKTNLYLKWCRKYNPFDLVYIHEIDTKKLGVVLKEARKSSNFTRKSVAEFLIISESALKMYELGERMPKINVLYAFSELYNINFTELISKSLI